MSYGTNAGSGNKNLTIFKIVTKDKEDKPISPVFSITKKINEKYEKQDEVCTFVAGTLKNILFSDGEWKDNTYQIVKLLLEDSENDEAYLIDLRYNGLTRNLFNSLLSVDVNEVLNISLWQGKDGWPRVTLRQNDKMVSWKFEIADLPKPIEIINPKTKKVEKRDYSDVDEFFVEKLKAFADENNFGKKSEGQSNEKPSISKEGKPFEPEDDIPF